MKYQNILLAVLLGGIIVSCKMGPAYKSKELTSNDAYQYNVEQSAKTDSLGDIKWWELFNDPVLDSLILVALDSNRDVRIAANQMEEARLFYKIQKAQLYPQVTGQANTGTGNYGGIRLPESTSNYFVGTQMNWEIDFWGKLRRLNEAAQAEYLATEYGYQNLRLAIVSDVAFFYFQMREFEASLEISKRTVSARDSTLKIIEARYAEGIVAEIDVNQAQMQRAVAMSAVPVYQRAAAQTAHALRVILGKNPGKFQQSVRLDSLMVNPAIPVGIPSEVLMRRPDLAFAEQKLIAQNARIGVAQAARYPSISLTGLLGISNDLGEFNSGGFAWNAGLNLASPLIHWGANKRKVEIEKLRTESAYLLYEQTVFNAFREVEDALVSIQTYEEEHEARKLHVRASSNAEFLSSQRYDKGITSYLEYLESQRQAFDAQLAYVAVKSALLFSYVQLYKALGGGWLTESEFEKSQTAE